MRLAVIFNKNFKIGIVTMLLSVLLCYSASSQENDTTAINDTTTIIATPVITKPFHSPKRASIYSAILPGAGQIYNKQYWKAPIAIAAVAIPAYQIGVNIKKFKEFKEGYVLATDTISGNELSQFAGINPGVLLQGVEFYRRNRDLSYFFCGLFYLLNILDAAVYAHLFYFDISEDISLNIQPYNSFSAQQASGLRLVMNF